MNYVHMVWQWFNRNILKSEKGRLTIAVVITTLVMWWISKSQDVQSLIRVVGVFVAVGLVGSVYYFIWRVFPPTYSEPKLRAKIAVNVQPWFVLATTFVAFGGIILSVKSSERTLRQSVEISHKALEQAREMAFIQARPYLAVEQPSFKIIYRATDAEARDGCSLVIPLSNSGSIPATTISTSLEVTFQDRNGERVRFTTNPDPKATPNDLNNVPITISTYSAAISPKKSREWSVSLLIDKADSKRIEDGEQPLILHATIGYSAPGIDKTWTYEMTGLILKQSFGIFDEKIT